jgi:hypothetical protein
MTEENGGVNAAIKKQGLIKGVVLGFIVLALDIFTFYFVTALTKSPVGILFGSGLFKVILPLAFSVVFILQIRENIGGYWSLRQAVTGAFIMFISCYFILIVGREFIFTQFVEPQMAQKTEQAMENAERIHYKESGIPQAQINTEIAKKHDAFVTSNKVTFGDVVGFYAIMVIEMFILSLVFGALFKKGKPLLV